MPMLTSHFYYVYILRDVATGKHRVNSKKDASNLQSLDSVSLGDFERMVTLRQAKMFRTDKLHRIRRLRYIFAGWQPKKKYRLQVNKKTLASDGRIPGLILGQPWALHRLAGIDKYESVERIFR